MESPWIWQLKQLISGRASLVAQCQELYQASKPIKEQVEGLNNLLKLGKATGDAREERKNLLAALKEISAEVEQRQKQCSLMDMQLAVVYFMSISLFHVITNSLPSGEWAYRDHPFFASSSQPLPTYADRVFNFFFSNIPQHDDDLSHSEPCACGGPDNYLTCRLIDDTNGWCPALRKAAPEGLKLCECMTPNLSGYVKKCISCIANDCMKNMAAPERLLAQPTVCALPCTRCQGVYCPFSLIHSRLNRPVVQPLLEVPSEDFLNLLQEPLHPEEALEEVVLAEGHFDSSFLVDPQSQMDFEFAPQRTAPPLWSPPVPSKKARARRANGPVEEQRRSYHVCLFCHGPRHMEKTCTLKKLALSRGYVVNKKQVIEEFPEILAESFKVVAQPVQETYRN